MQTDSSVTFGSPWSSSSYSVVGGKQEEISFAYYLFQNNWWYYVQDTAIGYFPTSVYNGGAMSQYATEIDYGGEVSNNNGATANPTMGSGQFADQGYKNAAYHRNISYYYTTTNRDSYWASLNPSQLRSIRPRSGRTATPSTTLRTFPAAIGARISTSAGLAGPWVPANLPRASAL